MSKSQLNVEREIIIGTEILCRSTGAWFQICTTFCLTGASEPSHVLQGREKVSQAGGVDGFLCWPTGGGCLECLSKGLKCALSQSHSPTGCGDLTVSYCARHQGDQDGRIQFLCTRNLL